MKIVTLDDEPRSLNVLNIILSRIAGAEVVSAFTDPKEALAYVTVNSVDLVFTDIEMPEMDGITFATAILDLPSPPHVVFVTGYKQYALDAWGVEAVDYILKPYDSAQIEKALRKAESAGPVLSRNPDNSAKDAGRHVQNTLKDSIRICCFPDFDVKVNGVRMDFRYKKTREMLAFLTFMEGQWQPMDNVCAAIFPGQDPAATKEYYRTVLYRLRGLLREAGAFDILEAGYGKCRVVPEYFTCDYYEYLAGSRDLFLGSFMNDFKWAQKTAEAMRKRS